MAQKINGVLNQNNIYDIREFNEVKKGYPENEKINSCIFSSFVSNSVWHPNSNGIISLHLVLYI